MQQALLDGWLLRFSRGFTKRANCIVPLYPSLTSRTDLGALEAKVRYCENLYAREKLQTIFRITSLHSDGSLERLLDQRGYASSAQTLVLTRQLEQPAAAPGELHLLSLEDWVHVYAELTRMPPKAVDLHRAILQGIQARCAFATLGAGEGWVACGLAVLEQDLLGLFDVVTAPSRRRQGFARVLVDALLRWGAQHGAGRAYLQMEADNEAAARLYSRLQFAPLYNYQYRISG